MQTLWEMGLILIIGHSTAANWKYSNMIAEIPGETRGYWTGLRRKTEQKFTHKERQVGQGNCGVIIWEQKPKMMNAIVYDCIRSVERNLEK